jgi:hypothetical protein
MQRKNTRYQAAQQPFRRITAPTCRSNLAACAILFLPDENRRFAKSVPRG